MGTWGDINERIKACRKEPDPVSCLRTLFAKTPDGMVALALGGELEKSGHLKEALVAYEDAERLFPKWEWKQRAREAADRVSGKLSSVQEAEAQTVSPAEGLGVVPETLFVVSCTRRKIWDLTPSVGAFVAAKDAYVGETMKSWLASDLCRQEPRWIILSAKYGFIEPDHPVADYDVTFTDDTTGPISLESLRA